MQPTVKPWGKGTSQDFLQAPLGATSGSALERDICDGYTYTNILYHVVFSTRNRLALAHSPRFEKKSSATWEARCVNWAVSRGW